VARADGPGPGLPTDFAEEVLDLVAEIPTGRVLTYADVADIIGRGGPRGVGTVMARFGADVPWWRVLRAGGLPPAGLAERAIAHYREEGTPLVGGPLTGRRVDLGRARWDGPQAPVG
jgi:alkylated DNA nucleotide flippase Atl1